MPPSIATLLTIGFVIVLFFLDSTKKSQDSEALWLPVLWMTIAGSRFVSQWINLGGGGDGDEEGSVIDALYFLSLILAGVFVLVRRRAFGSELIRQNQWLFAFILYSFLAILWSDFPFIALKRWVKTLGHPIMALIILTDPNPVEALRTVMKRCAYVLMPLSVLFIKYLPQYGRGFDSWSGKAGNFGVALNKNGLGYICMIFGLFFVWNLLYARRIANRLARRRETILTIVFLIMIGWLLQMSDSATSRSAVAVGALMVIVLGWHVVNKRYIGTYLIVGILLAVVIEVTFDAYAHVLQFLGRKPDLTDRTVVWADAIALQPNPLIGAGFESFWLGSRLDVLWAKWWWRPIQAHNGYIETYLNLGAIGVMLLVGLIVSTFRKITARLSTDFAMSRLRLGFLVAIVVYNYTEAAFKGVHLVWTIFMLIAIDCPRVTTSKAVKAIRGKTRLATGQGTYSKKRELPPV